MISEMASTSKVGRTSADASSLMSKPVVHPPTNTNSKRFADHKPKDPRSVNRLWRGNSHCLLSFAIGVSSGSDRLR